MSANKKVNFFGGDFLENTRKMRQREICKASDKFMFARHVEPKIKMPMIMECFLSSETKKYGKYRRMEIDENFFGLNLIYNTTFFHEYSESP